MTSTGKLTRDDTTWLLLARLGPELTLTLSYIIIKLLYYTCMCVDGCSSMNELIQDGDLVDTRRANGMLW